MAVDPLPSDPDLRDDEFFELAVRRVSALPSSAHALEQAYLSGSFDEEGDPMDSEWLEDVVRRARAEQPPRPRQRAGKAIATLALLSALGAGAWRVVGPRPGLEFDENAARRAAQSELDPALAAEMRARADTAPKSDPAEDLPLLYGGAPPEEVESKITMEGLTLYQCAGVAIKSDDSAAIRAMLDAIDRLAAGQAVAFAWNGWPEAAWRNRWDKAVAALGAASASAELRRFVGPAIAHAQNRLRQELQSQPDGGRSR